MAQIDIIFEDERWATADLEALAQVACNNVLDALSLPTGFEISILACDDDKIAELNGAFRDKATATNVLSWPSEERAATVAGGNPQQPDPEMPELGDIAIAYETCVTEAHEQSKAFNDHVTHLLIHATLHLLGYDHETEQDAALMEELETQILAKQGIADPY